MRVLALSIAVAACGKSPRLEDRSVDLTWHDLKATITARVPVDWVKRGQAWFAMPGDDYTPYQPMLSYWFGNRSCGAVCDDAAIHKNMDDSWPVRDEMYTRVSTNSGNARTDNIKLDVQTLEEGALTDVTTTLGRYKAVRITRPADAQDLPRYIDRFAGTCIRHRKGDEFYIEVSVVAPLDEQEQFAMLLEACKTPWFR